jgi:hypothetical protein
MGARCMTLCLCFAILGTYRTIKFAAVITCRKGETRCTGFLLFYEGFIVPATYQASVRLITPLKGFADAGESQWK